MPFCGTKIAFRWSFSRGKELCELKGNNRNSVHMSNATTMNKMLAWTVEVASVHLCNLSLRPTRGSQAHVFSTQIRDETKVALEIEKMLEQFCDVLTEPKGLPPRRVVDHTIRMKEGANPVSIHLYRYPAPQKDIIKKLVNEMIVSGWSNRAATHLCRL